MHSSLRDRCFLQIIWNHFSSSVISANHFQCKQLKSRISISQWCNMFTALVFKCQISKSIKEVLQHVWNIYYCDLFSVETGQRGINMFILMSYSFWTERQFSWIERLGLTVKKKKKNQCCFYWLDTCSMRSTLMMHCFLGSSIFHSSSSVLFIWSESSMNNMNC